MKLLVHTRTEADAQLLQNNFDLSKMGEEPKFVHGLTAATQIAIMKAALQGKKVVTNGLPVDIAAKIGEITQIRAWDKVKEDGSRSTGTSAPEDFAVYKIKDQEAFNILKQDPAFKDAFEIENDLDD